MFRSVLLLGLFFLVGCGSPAATRPEGPALPTLDEKQLAEGWEPYRGKRIRLRARGSGIVPLHPSGFMYSTMSCACYFPDERAHEFRGAVGEVLIEGVVDGDAPGRQDKRYVILRDCRRIYESQR